MSRAEDTEQRCRKNGFYVDIEGSATDESRVVLGVLVQIEGQGARLLLFHHFAGGLPDFCLYASTADRAADRSVVPHQHLGRLEGRDRAMRADNRCDGAPPAIPA